MSLVFDAISLTVGVSVADAILGIRGDSRDLSGSNNNKSVYATVRRYTLAAENAESDGTYIFLRQSL